MIDIKRILCPVDFSDYSRHALDHAIAMARWYESSVTVLYVHPLVPVAATAPGAPAFPPFVLTPADRERLLASMHSFAESVSADVPTQFEIVEGPVASEILARATSLGADVLVMGTHGRSGFERLMIGSVTERVLRKAPCPMLSVPPRVGGAAAAPPLFTRILCAVDFSDASLRGLQFATSLAQEADGHLTVLHVIEMPADAHELPSLSSGVREYVEAIEQDHRVRLDTVVPDSVRAYCEVETMMAHGKPYREILRVAAEQRSDLIVIGIHGRGTADLLFFGSTAQHVVRESTCAVLTLRQA